MKRKGFTLIEMIAATAILLIGIMGTTVAFSSSLKTLAKSNQVLNTTAYAQAIVEYYKSQGKARVSLLCPTDPSTNPYFIYFDSLDDLSNSLANDLFTTNPIGYKYVASIAVYIDPPIDSDPKNVKIVVYKLVVDVWQLSNKDGSKSELIFHVGR